MSIAPKGYVLERPRVGPGNSPYTFTPDCLVSDSGAYNAVFGVDESDPGRVEYLVLVEVGGDLPQAEFGWTKNEGIQRFDFDTTLQQFAPLRGGPVDVLGTVSSTWNTTRVRVVKPTAPLADAPYRLSLESGVSFVLTLVLNDAAFTVPASGTVELSRSSGLLNWAPSDLVTYNGQKARFQRQSFFALKDSSGNLGDASSAQLNPLPKTGQIPRIRLGSTHLTAVEVVNEGAFSLSPLEGTVEWSVETGRLNFNATDLLQSRVVYYDGVLMGTRLRLPRQALGAVGSPTIPSLPTEGADLIFRVLSATPVTGTAVLTSTNSLVDVGANFQLSARVGSVLEVTSGPYSGTKRVVSKVVDSTHLEVLPPFPARVPSCTYRIEAVRKQFAQATYVDSYTFPFGQVGVVELLRSSGQPQLSVSDQATYSTGVLELVVGDLPVERGLSLRLFRSPVDLEASNSKIEDTTSDYSVPRSLLADPIQGAPFVFLPARPLDSAAYPLTVEVEQGTGFFEGTLQRLDSNPTPSAGLGYLLNLDEGKVTFANHVTASVQNIGRVGAVALGAQLIQSQNLSLEIDQGIGYTLLTLDSDAILESNSGSLTFTTEVGREVCAGVCSIAGSTLTATLNFAVLGVLPEDLVVLGNEVVKVTSAANGSLQVTPNPTPGANIVFSVRRGKEVLADRFFRELYLADPRTKIERIRGIGTAQNSPRLTIAEPARFRIRLNGVLVTPSQVANDAAFTAVPSGSIQVALDTGHLNFSVADLGQTVAVALNLIRGVEYRISPELGVFQFVDRCLAGDEVLITYVSSADPLTVIEEQGRFLVRKEVGTHPTASNQVQFNPLGRSVAITPEPLVYRGGRPQTSRQVSVSTATSTVTFLSDALPTEGGHYKVVNDLPHGPIVTPDERVYIDYYIYEAKGGENTVTVQQPPMEVAKVVLKEDSDRFKVRGDRTSDFPMGWALRVEASQVHIIAGSTYDAGADETTVVVAGQPFQEDLVEPKLYLSSGVLGSTYFQLEVNPYAPVSRGASKVLIPGDATSRYLEGTILLFGTDSYLVGSSEVKGTQTEVTLAQNTIRQYVYGADSLSRSVRPVYKSAPKKAVTSASPILPNRYTNLLDSVLLFRQRVGFPGEVLGTSDFTLDPSGAAELTVPLDLSEEWSILYTKARLVGPGQIRASYTHAVVPSAANGLLGQVLTASFTTRAPDSFYFRVETLTNYRGELTQKYKAEVQSTIPSSGPRTDNSSQAKLSTQGRPSLFFEEGAYANEDTVSRGVLLFYHGLVNRLENLLQAIDGRVVGGSDGRLKYNGSAGVQVASFSAALNQIDDTFKASPFPLVFSIPFLPFVFRDTYVKAYEPGEESRFFPTRRKRSSITIAGANTGAVTGDVVADLEQGNVSSISVIERDTPRARLTEEALAGASLLTVDTTAFVDTQPLRPAFVINMKVVIQGSNGTFYVNEPAPAVVSSFTATTITLSVPLGVTIPKGSTVYAAPSDTVYRKRYLFGRDLTANLDRGSLQYVTPYPPLDGSFPAIPPELRVQTPDSLELLATDFLLNNTQTAPEKFPALYGGTTDDDGKESIPIQGPLFDREYGSPSTAFEESSAASGIQAVTTAPYEGTGSLSGGGTVITDVTPYAGVVPQPGDLVRCLSGLNAGSSFRVVTSAGANSVTVGVPFTPDTGFTYQVTVSPSLVSSVGATIGTTLTDLAVNFPLVGVRAGHTVVSLSGGSALERRQVVSRTTNTIVLSSAFSSPLAGAYKVVKPLNTFSDLGSLAGSSSILQSTLNSEVLEIDGFFSDVLTDVVPLASGTVTGTILTGVGVDFSDVRVGDYAYLPPTQTSDGVYSVTEVVSTTVLEVSSAFPTPSSVTFRVVRAFGASEQTLTSLHSFRRDTIEYRDQGATWGTLVNTAVSVEPVTLGVPDPSYYARGFRLSSLGDRMGLTSTRQSSLPTAIQTVEGVLKSGDKLYDRRYTWIDTRINREKGVLVQQKRAVQSRVKATADLLNQLIKLLAVEGS